MDQRSAENTPSRFLMVCLGNICRSPLAEGILRQKALAAGLNWEVDSAGTNGFHIGEAPHPLSQKVARLHGIEISGQRARRFTAADFQRFDKIYAMAGDVIDEMRRIAGRHFDPTKVGLLMNQVSPGKDLDVPDPWSGPESGYHEVYRMIENAADKIIRHATDIGGPANTPEAQAPHESAIL
jgi:protein-tyrosine phosphatase